MVLSDQDKRTWWPRTDSTPATCLHMLQPYHYVTSLTCQMFPPGSVSSQQPSELLRETCWSEPVSAELPQSRRMTRGPDADQPHTPEASPMSDRDSEGPKLKLKLKLEPREREKMEQ